MLMPDPDNERRLLSIKDFLDSKDDGRKRRAYGSLLAPLAPLATRINAFWPAPDGMPDVRIVTNAQAGETELRDMVNTVCLTEGLLDDCMAAQLQASEVLNARDLPRTLGPLSVAKMGVMRAYAHEAFHYLRRHALVEKHFGGDAATKHALEFDADSCAVAAVYRYVRYFSPNLSELRAKQQVLRNLYWSMRKHVDDAAGTDYAGSPTHPHASARVNDMVLKLAMMNDTGVADPNFAQPATHQHHKALLDVLVNLEMAYMGAAPGQAELVSPIAKFGLADVGLAYTGERHKRWDEIARLINFFVLMSRSQIDNEAGIAFLGDGVSMPLLSLPRVN